MINFYFKNFNKKKNIKKKNAIRSKKIISWLPAVSYEKVVDSLHGLTKLSVSGLCPVKKFQVLQSKKKKVLTNLNRLRIIN